MKRIPIFLILIIAFVSGFAQSDIPDLPTSPKAVIGTDAETGQQVKELYYVLKANPAIKHSEYRAFNLSDSLVKQGFYDKGKMHSTWMAYYNSEPYNLMYKGNYNQDAKVGVWTYYYNSPGKAKKEEINYNTSPLEQTKFHRNGSIEGRGTVTQQGNKFIETGKWTLYSTAGKIEAEGTFAGGNKTGEWTSYDASGNKKMIETYNNSGVLDGPKKFFTPAGDVDKTEFYIAGKLDRIEDKFTFLAEELDKLSKNANEQYKTFPVILSGEIAEINASIKNYSKETRTPENLKIGENLRDRFLFATNNFAKLTELNQSITASFAAIESKYKNFHGDVFESEMAANYKAKKEFESVSSVKLKLEKGELLINSIKVTDKRFVDLDANKKKIYEKLAEIEKYLKTDYPKIYNTEYTKIKLKSDSYFMLKTIDEKNIAANLLIPELETMANESAKIKQLDGELNNSSQIMDLYKNTYIPIYTNLAPLYDAAIKKFNGSMDISAKLADGASVMGYLKKIEVDFQSINNQVVAIKNKKLEFENAFKEDKENKYIYKRAGRLIEVYEEAYGLQQITTRKLSVGKEFIAMIDLFLGYKGKDNFELNEKLKEMVTTQEMKDAFGIKNPYPFPE
ncbi:MAG TPA: hypothetical protein DCQ31_11210 [Bacteroidales bacterium]|nr:hypothetical protein [Bacteroidales bacterium]